MCSPCSDANCLNCTTVTNLCTKCSALYSLYQNSCVRTPLCYLSIVSCPNTTKSVVSSSFNAQCLPVNADCATVITSHYYNQAFIKCDACANSNLYSHISSCVSSCPPNYIANANGYCICSGAGLITIYDQCLPLPGCPLSMNWDTYSMSCISCPYGCVTCKDSACTSCSPGYFLYISPQGIRCRRKSPLFPCDQQYGWIQGTCLVTNYTSPALSMVTCLGTIAGCMVCYPLRSDICILCNQGMYIYNNTCNTACPSGFIPYENSCILTEITNCANPYLMVKTNPFSVTYSAISKSDSYSYYTFSGKEPANDPVGYIPYYQQITKRKNDGQFRESGLILPSWTCLKCSNGFGLSNNFTQCLACPTPCVTCYMAQNYSCLTQKTTPNSACMYYTDTSGSCVLSCSSPSVPVVLDGILYCRPVSSAGGVSDYIKIDSSVYTQSDGSKQTFFVFSEPLNSNGVNISVSAHTPNFLLSAEGGKVATSAVSATTQVPLTSNSYVVLNNQSADVYMLNLTSQLSNLSSSNG